MIHFTKAHGLGNDFVIIDLEKHQDIGARDAFARRISNRRTAIGCDQILFYQGTKVWFYNADGSPAESCGNGTRCLAKMLMGNSEQIVIETPAGPVTCQKAPYEQIQVHMPKPTWESQENIQVRNDIFTKPPIFVHVGNPHLVCFVTNMEDLEDLGPILSRQFPEGANVGFVKITDKNHISLNVWERGTGITPACGSGACAAAVASFVSKTIETTPIKVSQNGGDLLIDYVDGELFMTGPAEIVFEGTIAL